MRLDPGTRLGPYEITAPLGAGGMGEVYRAKDSRLDRDVAIKVLPEHLIENPEMRARFEREAHSIASLNHPHICTLHDVGREGDVEYLVMELIDGETLSDRLTRGPLPLPETLRLAGQIADALDRAHRAGIVHRDFKPGNVMITRSGAKLMDFGLARAVAQAAGGAPPSSAHGLTIAALSQTPTIASPLTQAGSLVGTFYYMAPEQLEGGNVDARSDIWAFGCVLYEMLTGRHAFEGKSQAALVGAIMNAEPAAIALTNAALSPALDGLVRACLAKDPEERIQTAHDIKLQLTWLQQAGAHSGPTGPIELPKRPRNLQPLAWGVAAAALALAAFFALKPAPKPTRQIAFTIPIPPRLTPFGQPRISPDGSMLAFAATDSVNRTMIWIRPMNGLEPTPIAGTEGTRAPFWSPDSRSLAFFAGGKLKRVSVQGGPPQAICDAPTGADGTWGRKDVILFDGGQDDPIRRVNAAGGVPTDAVLGDSLNVVGWPAFLPDGKHFLYSKISLNGESQTMVGALDSDLRKELPTKGSRVEYTAEGYLLLARDRTLLAQRFDARSLSLKGEPFPIAEDLPVGVNGIANFAVSDDGTLVYRAANDLVSRLVWLDREGRELDEIAPGADYRAPDLSPDGTKVALRKIDPASSNLDIWVIDIARGTSTRLTFDAGDDANPIWSPDGTRIAWAAVRGEENVLLAKASNGTGAEERIAKLGGEANPSDWSRDGRTIVYGVSNNAFGIDIGSLEMTGDRTPRPLLSTQFTEHRARFSPDGRYLAYDSEESGRREVYVITFPGGSGKWQVSTSGGMEPAWSRDGSELFYLAPDGSLMSVPLAGGAEFHPGTPRGLFRVVSEPGGRRNVYRPSPDGKRFLFLVPEDTNQAPFTMLVNWRGKERR